MKMLKTNRTANASIGLIFLIVFAAPIARTEQVSQITVRLLDVKSNRPLKKISVDMFLWNGTWDIKKGLPSDYHVFSGRTNAEGLVVFDLPQSYPEHIGFHSIDLLGCSIPDFSVSEIIKSGAVAPYKHDSPQCYHGTLTGKRTPVAGEVIIYDQKVSAGQRLLREIPEALHEMQMFRSWRILVLASDPSIPPDPPTLTAHREGA